MPRRKVKTRKKRLPSAKKTTANKVKVKVSNDKKEKKKIKEKEEALNRHTPIKPNQWARVKGFNKEEVELFIGIRRWQGTRQEVALKRFFYWNFLHNESKGISFINDRDSLKYMNFLYELGYEEDAVRRQFKVLIAFSTHLLKRYKTRVFKIKYFADGMRKKLDSYMDEADYMKLLEKYIDEEQYGKATLLAYAWDKNYWYSEVKNFTIDSFESLIYIPQNNIWVENTSTPGGLVLSNTTYLCANAWLKQRREEYVRESELFFINVVKKTHAKDPGRFGFYRQFLEILSDYLTMLTKRRVVCDNLREFNYQWLTFLAKREKKREAWREWNQREKDKRKEKDKEGEIE